MTAAHFSKFAVTFARADGKPDNRPIDIIRTIAANGFVCDTRKQRKGARVVSSPTIGEYLYAKWEYTGATGTLNEAKAAIADALGQRAGKLLRLN